MSSEEPEVGTVHEEAVRLLGVLGEWAHGERTHEEWTRGQQSSPEADHLEGDCRFCPLCQVIHAVRQTSPEVREHLTTAAAALLQAAAELLATRPGTPGTDGTQGSAGAAVERINLDDDPSPSPT